MWLKRQWEEDEIIKILAYSKIMEKKKEKKYTSEANKEVDWT